MRILDEPWIGYSLQYESWQGAKLSGGSEDGTLTTRSCGI